MDRTGNADRGSEKSCISGVIVHVSMPWGIYLLGVYVPGFFMKREKLKLIMGILIVVMAYYLSRQGVIMTAQMRTVKPQTGSSGYVVVIDPGHGGSDPGKVSASGTEEKDVNLQISLLLKSLLEAQDVTVYMTRMTDEGLYDRDSRNKKTEDLRKRCEQINEKRPDCVVSIHQNSYHEPEIHGAQTFYYTGSQDGKRLAERIQESLIKRLDPENHREAKSNSSYFMLKHTQVPITIVECGFLSNPREAELLIDPDYQEKAAWAIHMGILYYLNEEK